MPLHGFRLKGPGGTFGTIEAPLTKAEIEALFLEGRIDTDWQLSHTFLPRYWVPITKLSLRDRSQTSSQTTAGAEHAGQLTPREITDTGDSVRGGPEGLHGWLVLVGLALWASLLVTMNWIYETMAPLIERFSGQPVQDSVLITLLFIGSVQQLIVVGLLGSAVILYHTKHCYFPPVLVLVNVFNLGGLVFVKLGMGLGLSISLSILCIVYTLVSVRVKNTFLFNC